MSQKPTKVEVYLYFSCKCGFETRLSLRQAKTYKKVVCEYCGGVFSIDAPRIYVKYGAPPTKEVKKGGDSRQPSLPPQVDFAPILSCLMSLGLTKKEAKKRVEDNKYLFNGNIEDFIAVLLERIK